MAKVIRFYIPEEIQAAGQVERANRNRQGAGVSCRGDEKVRITSDMNDETRIAVNIREQTTL